MDQKAWSKLINILFMFLVFMMIMNFFTWEKKQETLIDGIHITSTSTNYSVPDLPEVFVYNKTNVPLNYNTCKELEIYKNGQKIEKINEAAPTFCKDIMVNPQEKQKIDFSKKEDKLYTLFQQPWDFIYKLKIGDKEVIGTTKQVEKWFFGKFFYNIFYAPVFNLFVFIIQTLPNHSLALAIILITLIVRFAILIPQNQIMVNGKKMQKIQPKIKEIQDKHKWDQAKIWMELMELYKREQVNPAWACLPLLFQIPILLVLYWVISSIWQVTNIYYLYPFFSGFSTSIINYDLFWINLLSVWGKVWLIFAIIIWIAQRLQMYLSMKKDKKTEEKQHKKDIASWMPDMEMINKTMMFAFPVMIAFSTYYFPIWVWIYWFMSTIFSIVQQLYINSSFKKNEEKTKNKWELITK